MVQAQVAAQLETKVAERVADLVVEQNVQIVAKVAVHVSNYEKAQIEWFKKLSARKEGSYHLRRVMRHIGLDQVLVRVYDEDVIR
ncbi:hypothetical protein Tco_1181548 [Tanacetum coccineum]